MATLGDFFPKDLKSTVVAGNLKIGSVFRIFDHSTTPPKIKRFIVVGTSEDAVVFATVFINTEINPHLFPTIELKNLHLSVDAASRNYLDHDSFIDCSQLIEKDINELRSTYEKDMKSHLGDVSESDLTQIKEKIKGARTISKNEKKKFGLH